MGGKGSGDHREERRLKRIAWVLELVGKTPVKKEACIGTIQLKFGTTRRTSLEYVNVLLSTGKIKEVEGLWQIKKK